MRGIDDRLELRGLVERPLSGQELELQGVLEAVGGERGQQHVAATVPVGETGPAHAFVTGVARVLLAVQDAGVLQSLDRPGGAGRQAVDAHQPDAGHAGQVEAVARVDGREAHPGDTVAGHELEDDRQIHGTFPLAGQDCHGLTMIHEIRVKVNTKPHLAVRFCGLAANVLRRVGTRHGRVLDEVAGRVAVDLLPAAAAVVGRLGDERGVEAARVGEQIRDVDQLDLEPHVVGDVQPVAVLEGEQSALLAVTGRPGREDHDRTRPGLGLVVVRGGGVEQALQLHVDLGAIGQLAVLVDPHHAHPLDPGQVHLVVLGEHPEVGLVGDAIFELQEHEHWMPQATGCRDCRRARV